MKLTEQASKILESRYLLRTKNGEISETPRQLFRRVAMSTAQIEKKANRRHWARKFEALMAELRFLPNTPTLLNAGKVGGQLSACFVLPIEDSLDSIFDGIKSAAKIHQSGGGTGFDFSKIRPKGARVNANCGVASGPVSFLKIYDLATETIKQGGARRGANMGVLRVDHPDILEFICVKQDLRSLTNFNLSIGITDKFMAAVSEGGTYELRDPSSCLIVGKLNASDILFKMAESAWLCGDPGVLFLDRINQFNPTPRLGAILATNPCGEQPLLPYESCNLGSMNLVKYVYSGGINWEALGEDIWTAVRFLDNVIEANRYPLSQTMKATKRSRKIGLGLMGFADALLKLEIRYGSLESIRFAESVMAFLDRRAKQASMELAKEKGAFPAWAGSLWWRLGYPKMRNAAVSTVAPTGTISMIAGVSSGIEPIFSKTIIRNVLNGARLEETRDYGDDHPAWVTAMDISPQEHLMVQAAFQRHTDSAVSKTINLPMSSTVEAVRGIYLMAYQLGCKGVTVYRDKSRPTQVLEGEKGHDLKFSDEWCPVCV